MTVARNLSLLSPNVSSSGTVNNAGLTNSSITINGTAVSLGGTATIGQLGGSSSTVTFLTANTERARITSTGEMGIGTTTPGQVLDVVRNQNAATVLRIQNTNTGASATSVLQLQVGASSYVNFQSNSAGSFFQISAGGITAGYVDFDTQIFRNNAGTEQMRLNTTGLGIGTSSPGFKLDVSGVARLGNGVAASAPSATDILSTAHTILSGTGGNYLTFGQYPAGQGYAQWIQSSYLNPSTAAYNLILNPLGGNVGIGTSSPIAQLAVYGAGQTTAAMSTSSSLGGTLYVRDSGSAAGNGGAIMFGANQGAFATIKGLLNDGTSNTNGSIAFSTRNSPTDAALIERMRLDFSGNLGIGTSSPAYKLVVSNGGASGIEFGPAYSGTANLIQSYNRSGAAYVNTVYDASEHRFNTSGTEKMRLDSSGNLGIGTTSPSTRLHVAGGSTTEVRVVSSGNITTGAASILRWGDSNSATSGYVGYGGTSNTIDLWNTLSGSITFGTNNTERARIDSSGNLGIGTSSPATKLHVYGNNATIESPTSGDGNIRLKNTGQGYLIGMLGSLGSTALSFYDITANAERARFDTSGNLLIGTTSASALLSSKFQVVQTSGYTASFQMPNGSNGIACTNTSGTAAYQAMYFFNNGTSYSACGYITVSGSTTSYTSLSDYRLKDNISPMTNALEKIAQLKPVTYTWKRDGSSGQGFIAHELAEVVPSCVTGEKDAINTDGKPEYQGVDTSFLVATLTAAIQEQQVLINQLTARLTAAGL